MYPYGPVRPKLQSGPDGLPRSSPILSAGSRDWIRLQVTAVDRMIIKPADVGNVVNVLAVRPSPPPDHQRTGMLEKLVAPWAVRSLRMKFVLVQWSCICAKEIDKRSLCALREGRKPPGETACCPRCQCLTSVDWTGLMVDYV
jgi:hypothetical protein